MSELWLKFIDENGIETRRRVEGDVFTIGRHSENDLTIPDPRLSRDHVRIERADSGYLVSDMGSSNGTELNGRDLLDPAPLRSGDALMLGGGVPIEVEIIEQRAAQTGGGQHVSIAKKQEVPAAATATSTAPASSGGFPITVLLLAPLMGLIVVVFAGGLIYIFSGSGQANATPTDDIDITMDDISDEPHVRSADPTPDNDPSPGPVPNGTTGVNTSTGGDGNTNSSPTATGETAAVERSSAAFLRKIAQNDPKAFLTSEQARRVAAKIRQVASSPSLAANIASANKSSAQVATLARTRNLKPEFLAVAAINRLGARQGDVLQTAHGMIDVLDKLSTQIGTELAEDPLLIIAAYSQGEAGEFLKMRNMLQKLSNQYPDSSRAIRTVWFLEQNGKISAAEFDRALTFLAIGTITQNPKDFGVTAEALKL